MPCGARCSISSPADEELSPDGLAVLCAVARQCFVNEYVSGASDDERHGAAALGDRLAAAAAQGEDVPPQWIAAVAAYHPLASLPGAERLVERTRTPTWPAPVAALLAQQIAEPRTERELRATLPRLTAFEDGVSRAVKQQYEENPYPRWITAGPAGTPVSLDAYLQAKFPDYRPLGRSPIAVLIAGCGTGQHAIETAQRFADADVLAIDLSESSLAYALRKTGERGLPISNTPPPTFWRSMAPARPSISSRRAACSTISPIPLRHGAGSSRCCAPAA